MLACTACDRGHDVEYVHPVLGVPICASCNVAIKEVKKHVIVNFMKDEGGEVKKYMKTVGSGDEAIKKERTNDDYCIWCGFGDGNELFMCDDCDYTFCNECVIRNLGKPEAKRVRHLKPWSCYVCIPTKEILDIKLQDNTAFYTLDRAYATVRLHHLNGGADTDEQQTQSLSPAGVSQSHLKIGMRRDVEELDPIPTNLLEALTPSERAFASLFTGSSTNTSVLRDLRIISEYLLAQDLFSCMYRISKNLRVLFMSRVFVLPGLFKTPHGEEHQCKLHPHQVESLNTMIRMETRDRTFGALRGGIFGDEPG